jgi:myosin heavy subunit
MQIRHRVPTIFSIYMLDVICCALGCVILLWQVNQYEADLQTTAAKKAQGDYEKAEAAFQNVSTEIGQLKTALDASRKKVVELSVALLAVRSERDDALKLAVERQKENDKTKATLVVSEDLLKQLKFDFTKLKKDAKQVESDLQVKLKLNDDLLAKLALLEKDSKVSSSALEAKSKLQEELLAKLAAAQKDAKATTVELQNKTKLHEELLARLALSDKKLSEMTVEVTQKQKLADEAAKKLQTQLALLETADAKNRKLEAQLAELSNQGKDSTTKLSLTELRMKLMEQELERNKKELAESGTRFKDLLKSHDTLSKQLLAGVRDLTEVRTAMLTLESEKSKLLDKNRVLTSDAEQRFAGITLTGKSVVFLVDISGSMGMRDSKTEDKEKWPAACESIAKLMRSLPELERFQVILFNDRVQYLFGHEGKWLKFAGPETVGAVLDKLKTVTPKDGTNLYGAFQEAFRFRDDRLDTIYLFSDGLPNVGEGVPADQLAKLNDAQQTELLSKHLRQKLSLEWNPRIGNRPPRVRINAIGFFFESPEVGAFLWALAREHDGSFVGMSRP